MLLSKHTWPGNIRELENVITYCCMMSRSEVIDAIDLPPYLHGTPALPETPDQLLSMETMRLQYVKTVLERTGGNQSRAAHILGIGRSTLRRYLKSPAA